MTRWLHLAAAPTFMIMALVTAVSGGSALTALCPAGDGMGLGGMTPMYLLMAVFHSPPWLKLASRRGGVTLFTMLNRPSNIQTMEQKP